jgi:hypothetical protein
MHMAVFTAVLISLYSSNAVAAVAGVGPQLQGQLKSRKQGKSCTAACGACESSLSQLFVTALVEYRSVARGRWHTCCQAAALQQQQVRRVLLWPHMGLVPVCSRLFTSPFHSHILPECLQMLELLASQWLYSCL